MKNQFAAVIGLAAMLLLLVAVACTSSAPPLAPTKPSVSVRPTAVPTNLPESTTGIQETPTTIEPAVPATPDAVSLTEPASGQPSGPSMVEMSAPIESVTFAVSVPNPPAYTLQITSGIPGGCVKFYGYETLQEGNTIFVNVTNTQPAQAIPCTAIYAQHEGEVVLDGQFTPGQSYTVVVNGEVTNSFVGRDPEGGKKVVKESSVVSVELVILESFPSQYRVKVLSTMSGSSCSQFNGYDVSRPYSSTIQVKVTYLLPAGEVMCTRDIAYAETDIPLGSDFVSKEEYTVVVNGVTETFKAQ